MKISFSISILILLFSCSESRNKPDFCSSQKYSHRTSILKSFKYIKADTMNVDEFWKLIEISRFQSDDNLDRNKEILTSYLSQYSLKQIIEFECILEKILSEANYYEVMAAAKIIDGYVSDDSWIYFRCWLVSLGRETFYNTIKNPETLADISVAQYGADFEDLLYISTKAYNIRNKNPKEKNSVPRDTAFNRGLNYDMSPNPMGTDWKEEDLPNLYPRLYCRYWKD